MTYDEYIKESNRIKNKHKSLSKLYIVFATIILLLSIYACHDNCSESVFSWVLTLNFIIWSFMFYVYGLRGEKTKSQIEKLLTEFEKGI